MPKGQPKPAPKKRGGRRPILDPELVAAALTELDGNISGVAKRFNVHRSSVQELIGKRPSLQRVLTDAREGMLDDAENALRDAVRKGEAWAVCFFLKTQGKGRGYSEKPDDEKGGDKNGSGGIPVELLTKFFALLGTQPTGSGTASTAESLATETGSTVGGVAE